VADIFNPIFGDVAGNVTGTIVSQTTAGVKGKIESGIRKLTAPLTNNRNLAPIIGAVLGSMQGSVGDPNISIYSLDVAGPLGDARNRPDPAWAHNFEAAFTGNDLLMMPGAYIEDVDLPFYQFDRLSHYRGGKNYYYPGDFDLSQFSVRLYEDRFLTTTQALHWWKKRIRNSDNTVNMPSEYKRNLVVSIKDDQRQIIGTAVLIGCWPISPSPLSLQSGSAERIIISSEFSADDIRFEFRFEGI
jgi:hypothetical protein